MSRCGPLAVACVLVIAGLGCEAPSMRPGRARQAAAADVRVELTAIGDRTWVLVAWRDGEPAAATPLVTLRYAAGSFSGRSGCNRYTAPVEQRPGRGAIAVGAIAVTRMMCPEPIYAVEKRFLEALGAAKAIELREGRLAIVTTAAGGKEATLVFTPEAPPPS